MHVLAQRLVDGYIPSDVSTGLKLLCVPHRDMHVARLYNLVKAWQTNLRATLRDYILKNFRHSKVPLQLEILESVY